MVYTGGVFPALRTALAAGGGAPRGGLAVGGRGVLGGAEIRPGDLARRSAPRGGQDGQTQPRGRALRLPAEPGTPPPERTPKAGGGPAGTRAPGAGHERAGTT